MVEKTGGLMPDVEAARRGPVGQASLQYPSPGSDAGSGRRTSSVGGSQRRLTVDGQTVDHEGKLLADPCICAALRSCTFPRPAWICPGTRCREEETLIALPLVPACKVSSA